MLNFDKNLKYPWLDKMPKDVNTWNLCKEQFEEALNCLSILSNNLFFMKIDVENAREIISKSTEPKETITISEFKNLPLEHPRVVTQERVKYALSGEFHEKQLKNLKIGDCVFYQTIKQNPVNEMPKVSMEIMQAKLIEG